MGAAPLQCVFNYAHPEFDSQEGKLSLKESHQILFSKGGFMCTLRFSGMM